MSKSSLIMPDKSASSATPYLNALQEIGFVHVPNLLSASELSALRSATSHSTKLARSGKWPFIRTLPKQFPPWPSTPPPEGIWGVQHLMHPEQSGRDVFIRSYFKSELLSIVEEILGVRPGGSKANGLSHTNGTNGAEGDEREDLVMELYNLLVRPDQVFELRWHRDDIPPSASAAEEESALGVADGASKPATYSHTQWNLALYPDSSLIVVPGTHKRARTAVERDAGPYDELPGQLEVHLEPGDVVFYDNDILHRGKYDSKKERATLHGSIGKAGFAQKRARNVLQHGVGDWIKECGFEGLGESEGQRRRAEGMKRNLVEMGSGVEVKYSQPD